MKKILIKANRYMSADKKLYEKGKVYEMTDKDWKTIPEKDKPLFADPKPAVEKAEAVPAAPGEKKDEQ